MEEEEIVKAESEESFVDAATLPLDAIPNNRGQKRRWWRRRRVRRQPFILIPPPLLLPPPPPIHCIHHDYQRVDDDDDDHDDYFCENDPPLLTWILSIYHIFIQGICEHLSDNRMMIGPHSDETFIDSTAAMEITTESIRALEMPPGTNLEG